MGDKRKKEKTKSGRKQPLSPLAYAIISLVAFFIGIGLFLLFIFKANDFLEQGIDKKVFYVLLLPMGLSAAAFLFGTMRSYARYKGKIFSGVLELGGPVVLFVLVVVGGFMLVSDTGSFDFTISLRNRSTGKIVNIEGQIKVFLEGKPKAPDFNRNGCFYFENIPSKFKKHKFHIALDAPGWQFTNDKKTIKLKLNGKSTFIEIERDSTLAEVSGTVRDQDGKFLENVEIHIQGLKTKTNKHGWFKLNIPENLQKEEQFLTASKETYENESVYVYPASKEKTMLILNKKIKNIR